MCLLVCAAEGSAFAQRTDGGGGPDIPDFPDVPNTPTQEPVDDGSDDLGGNNTGTGGGEDGEIDEVEPLRLNRTIEDQRNQGFVGPTAGYTDTNGFVGPPRGEPEGDDLPPDGRFRGGGVNQGLGQRQASASSVFLERGFQPEENGFTVQRSTVRTRLVPAFAAPRQPSAMTVSRFQTRIQRQPVVRSFGQGISISVSNRTAVLTGVVRSQAERDIVTRQLRLEPGIYKIDDRTTIAN